VVGEGAGHCEAGREERKGEKRRRRKKKRRRNKQKPRPDTSVQVSSGNLWIGMFEV
jgi:hypothetical protein